MFSQNILAIFLTVMRGSYKLVYNRYSMKQANIFWMTCDVFLFLITFNHPIDN
jgi:hypothetical protein